MPRIAVAIFVVVAVSVSIGINITRYPAVFEGAGSTHESLVSNDTKEVSETEETEGPVAVNALPALPDDLAKWNPPMVRDAEPTATEAVPYVAAYQKYPDRYEDEIYPPTSQPSAETHEVEPSRPYLENKGEKQEESAEQTDSNDKEPKTENIADDEAALEQPSYDTPVEEKTESENTNPTEENAAETLEVQPAEARKPVETQPVKSESTPYVPSDNERPRPGVWPATVADSFRYNQENVQETPRSGLAPYDNSQPQAEVTVAKQENPAPSVRKPLHQVNSTMVFEEKSDWEAAAPMVAFREDRSSSYETPSSGTDEKQKEPNAELDQTQRTPAQIKRLPEVSGVDILPGALPPAKPIDYPVTR